MTNPKNLYRSQIDCVWESIQVFNNYQFMAVPGNVKSQLQHLGVYRSPQRQSQLQHLGVNKSLQRPTRLQPTLRIYTP